MTPALVVYEDHGWPSLLPLVYNRSVMQLTCGRFTLLGRIQHLSPPRQLWCRQGLAKLVAEETGLATNDALDSPALLLNGRAIWRRIPELSGSDSWVGRAGDSTACVYADAELASRLTPEVVANPHRFTELLQDCESREVGDCCELIEWPWDLVHANGRCLVADWEDDGSGGGTDRVDSGTHLLNPEAIRIGAGSRVKPGAVIDAEKGPVWIGKRVTVQPHAYIQGPCSIADDVLLQPGAVVHEDCSIGAHCKIGGEVEASIIQAYSNKQHDGFLGHSLVGSWVNMGADSVTSDLKNTYGPVRVSINGREVDSGHTFVGSIIGDHSKIGIGVTLPTGAVIGFGSNVLVGACPKFAPSFSWLDGGDGRCDIDRAVEVATRMMQRRGRQLSSEAEAVFRAIPALSARTESRP